MSSDVTNNNDTEHVDKKIKTSSSSSENASAEVGANEEKIIKVIPRSEYKDALLVARDAIDKMLAEKACGPIMVRLAWHDAGTYDKNLDECSNCDWPKMGGANGSIRFGSEINHGANAGLINAVKLIETAVRENSLHPSLSYADLIQMASARAIEYTGGGPNLGIRYGRKDVTSHDQCQIEGNLPDGEAGKDGNFGGDRGTKSNKSKTAEGHLRKIFYRMGFDDEEIVALSGAHTLGRSYPNRSGLGKDVTDVTDGVHVEQKFADGTIASYKPGGSSWTKNFFIFDNSYYKSVNDDKNDGDETNKELLKLSSDKAVFKDEQMRPYAEKFRDSQDAFFDSYVKAHRKLSELGSKFIYEPPIEL